jgi:hypothetical protein
MVMIGSAGESRDKACLVCTRESGSRNVTAVYNLRTKDFIACYYKCMFLLAGRDCELTTDD